MLQSGYMDMALHGYGPTNSYDDDDDENIKSVKKCILHFHKNTQFTIKSL